MVVAQRVQRLAEADQVDRDQHRALVDELVEAVLAVGARLAPEHRAGVVVHVLPGQRDVLAVGLHGQLLQVGREPLEVLLVRHDAVGLAARRSRGTRAPAGPSAPAGSAPAARCGSARPSRGTRPASRRTPPGRAPPWSTARSRSPSSTGRRPSPRTRTCSPCRCRTRPPARRWSIPPRSAWPPRPRPPSADTTQSRAEVALVSVSSVPNVLEEMMNSVSAGVQVPGGLDEVGRVHVGHEPERDVPRRCSAAAPRTPSPAPGRSRRCRR